MTRLPTSGSPLPPPCACRRALWPLLLAVVALTAAGGSASAAQGAPPSNLELIIDTAALAVGDGLAGLDLNRLSVEPRERPAASAGAAAPALAVHVAARGSHNANWVVEHALLEELLSRGIAVVADSMGAPTLSYRIVELGIWGYSGVLRSSVERRCRVSLSLQLEAGGELTWTGDAAPVLTDRVEKRRIQALQNSTYSFANTEVEEQSWGKYVEPVIVSSVLGSLVYLFFSNR